MFTDNGPTILDSKRRKRYADRAPGLDGRSIADLGPITLSVGLSKNVIYSRVTLVLQAKHHRSESKVISILVGESVLWLIVRQRGA
jgi:hypothetical protein